VDAFLDEQMKDEMRIIKCAPHPKRWAQFASSHELAWQFAEFRTGGANEVPKESGFYCFVVANPATQLPLVLFPLYAGESSDLRRRYRDYLTEKDSPTGRVHVRKFLSVFWGEVAFAYAPKDLGTAERRALEKQLNDALMPPYSLKDFSAEPKARRAAWQ